LDIAQNPNINNLFFAAELRLLLAKAYIKISDYESAKMNIDFALALSKKYGMNDLLSKVYLVYARYYQDLGTIQSPNQMEYLKGAKTMYDRALDTVVKHSRSVYMKDTITENRNVFDAFCESNEIVL
jgi:Tfp pilus assembly protein PilF